MQPISREGANGAKQTKDENSKKYGLVRIPRSYVSSLHFQVSKLLTV